MTHIQRLALGLLFLPLLGTAACSSDAGSQPTASTSPSIGSTARVGSLQITGAYVREPARPTSAAAYLTIVNTGAVTDTLVKTTTDVTAMVEPMTEFVRDGKKGMQPISVLTIPAHGRLEILPGHKHLMLMNQNRTLRVGETVTMTLTFAHAGSVTFRVPITPLTGAQTAASGSPDMSTMPGMG